MKYFYFVLSISLLDTCEVLFCFDRSFSIYSLKVKCFFLLLFLMFSSLFQPFYNYVTSTVNCLCGRGGTENAGLASVNNPSLWYLGSSVPAALGAL